MIKENIRANLRVIIKRILRKYGYPPDMQKLATENVLKQAEMLANEITYYDSSKMSCQSCSMAALNFGRKNRPTKIGIFLI